MRWRWARLCLGARSPTTSVREIFAPQLEHRDKLTRSRTSDHRTRRSAVSAGAGARRGTRRGARRGGGRSLLHGRHRAIWERLEGRAVGISVSMDEARFQEARDPGAERTAGGAGSDRSRGARSRGGRRQGIWCRADDRRNVTLVTAHATPADQQAAGAPPAIAFRGVSKRSGDHTAVESLDLEIREGEFFCLLGPSGCGKTTTLNLIGGFAEASTGEIRIRGEVVNRTPPHKRKVNTVFQSYALFPHLNVRDNVAFGLRMAKVPRRQTDTRVLEALQTGGPRDVRRPLSSTAIGRPAAARRGRSRPGQPSRVLLLDEPLVRLTSSCESGSRSSFHRFSARSGRPSCLLPTTRARRWRWPIASRS